jgi:subtilase family serine protease
VGRIDNHKAVVVEGHLHPLARAEFDHGAVPPDFALRGMTVTVRRTAAQQGDLDRLLAAQQDPSSPHYRKWLTPEEFADRFGASSNDLGRLREWLEGQGLQIKAMARARTFIRFDATAEQVRHAFGTEIHHYSVNGAMHYANAGPPMLPAALAPLLLRVGGMDDFAPHPDHVAFARLKNNATVAPDYSYGDSLHALAPADLLAVYDIGALTPVPDGFGQTVVIIGSSDITATDLQVYCTLSTDALCGTSLLVESPGGDPGSDPYWAREETMDLELVSAVAPGAALVLEVDTSVWNAFSDAVDFNRGQVISMSFGVCEQLVDASLVSSIQAAAQQANAQGITLIASSGDSGGAGCDSGTIAGGGAHAAAVDLPASLPEVTGVGGTEFTEGSGTFWSGGTATGYIPEEVWNDTTATLSLAASGGGVSTLFPKPAWQSGTGVANVPADGQRDVPDIALAASAVHDGYVIAINGLLTTAGDPPITLGGTSASAAVFAGMVALLNESLGSGSGNINAALYTIAGGSSGGIAFHDVVTGNNMVPCASNSDCSSTPPQLGWNAGTGYDLATGLGSVDESQLLIAWPTGYDTAPADIGLSPSSAGVGSSTLSVSIAGTGFTNLSSVTWTAGSHTTVLASSCTSSTSCSATVPASLLTGAGTALIVVVSASGLNSASASFIIASAPTIIGPLSPPSANAGDAPFTLAVTGTNFVGSSTVVWGSTSLFTTYVGATSLTANVTNDQLASAGSQTVTVKNPTGVSNGITFTVNGPAIGTNGLTPNSVVAGTGSLTLTVTGTNFASGSTVMWGATALATNPTTPGSTTSLTAAVTGTQVASAGPQNITVQDAYGVSGASVFTVNGPTITTLTPNSALAGSLTSPATLSLAVAGTNFVSGVSTVYWGSTALDTTYNSASSLTAYVTSTQFASSGSGRVTVQNGGATAASGASLFAVNGPTIVTLTPNSAFAGSLISPATLAVAVAGANFVSGSTVYWGSTALATTYNSASSLTAYVTSTQLASTGSGSITVQNTATAVSTTSPFTVSGPTITTLTPNSAVAGSLTSPATLSLAVTGTNFVSGSTVYWGSTMLSTTYNSASSLTAYVTSTQLASSGPGSITVQNTATAASAASPFTVSGPTIASLSLSSIVAGTTTATPITVTGANFITVTLDGSGNYATGSMVYSGTTALAVTGGNLTSITAAVPASLVTGAGKLSLTVHNPGGATSSAYALTVVGPTITALSAPSAIAGSSGFSLTVTGTNFINPGSVVMWGSTPLVTNYNSATSLTAAVTSAQLASAGPHNVTVRNSNAVSPSPLTFTVDGPIITSLSLNSIAAGTTSQSVTITGTNFIAVTLDSGNYASGSLVYSGTTALAVTSGTATSIAVTIPANLVSSAGILSLTVQNPGGASSSVRTFTVNGPTIASLSPNPAVAGSLGFQLTVTGTNFVNGSKVWWNGTQLATNFVGATSLTASVTSAQLRSAGSQNVTVRNSSAASSSASAFTVTGPTITTLSPASAAAGDVGFTLTVTGMNFVGGSTVYWGATALTTNPSTPGSTTSLAATVTTAQLASAGQQNVTVHNSSTASSVARTFTVNAPTITSLSPNSAVAGATSFSLTVTGTNFVSGSKVLWNSTPLTIASYNCPTSLTATVASALLNSAGSARVTVQNSSAVSSSASAFAVNGPTIASRSPNSIAAGSTTATIALTGANFIDVSLDGSGNYAAGSLIYSGATALPVTSGNQTSITAAIPAHLVAGIGTLSLTVHNPGGAKSSVSTVTVVGPTIASLTPNSAPAGSAPFSLNVTGTNFVAGSTVYWGATPLTPDPTSPGTATSLTALVTSAQLASAGSQKVTVRNSSTAISPVIAFVVNGPTITSLSPNSMAAGSATFALTVTGIDFVSGSRVRWGTTALATNPTTPGSTTSLMATVTSAQLASAGSPKVTVQNTSAASSSAIAFTVNSPMIASLSPTSAVAGGAGFALTVIGTNFVAGSKVLWGGKPLATSPSTPGSTTSLTATVTSAQLASAGSPKVTVQNTSTASSPAIAFTVTRP